MEVRKAAETADFDSVSLTRLLCGVGLATARRLINGPASADDGDVIAFRKLLISEGED